MYLWEYNKRSALLRRKLLYSRPFNRSWKLWYTPMEQKAELRFQIRISDSKQCGFRNKKDMVPAWKTLMRFGKQIFILH